MPNDKIQMPNQIPMSNAKNEGVIPFLDFDIHLTLKAPFSRCGEPFGHEPFGLELTAERLRVE
jgi:hypothetical protein